MQRCGNRKSGFSLVELVVVIVIIGILAAIAIPRLSRGAGGARDSSLSSSLVTIRGAISLYATEHAGTYPGPTAATFTNQMTMSSNAAGATVAKKDPTHIFGPYLAAIPGCPVGENAKSATILIDATNSPPGVVTTGGEGWVYNPTTGEFVANTTQTDDAGKAYNIY